ncbi:helix-turn-helix domain-containing protein [Luteirhabdus pelagi]|uniref:helix-turn-helix domain-containing protein n=1 Tax=Luteirhabdus pelagi TaxID=2792783 RepID=UPI00193AAFA7|nr:helix-turn-helix transcriptional regulator [Luteirhabdus pelagi]
MNIQQKQELLNAFGKNLSRERKQKGLSYRELSLRCDVDYSQISKIEKGQVSIQITTLFELACGLGIPVKDLLDFDFTLGDQC